MTNSRLALSTLSGLLYLVGGNSDDLLFIPPGSETSLEPVELALGSQGEIAETLYPSGWKNPSLGGNTTPEGFLS